MISMKVTLSEIRKGIIILFILLLSGGIGYHFGQKDAGLRFNQQNFVLTETAGQDIEKKVDFSLFWVVWNKLEEKHLDRKNFDYQKMVWGAISGLASSLGDPYTSFLPPSENKDAKDDLRGDFEGVGIEIGYDKEKRLSVIAPLDGSPAKEAGLKAKDIILFIKDEVAGVNQDTSEILITEAVRLIRGKRGTKVTLTIYREGIDKPFDVTMKRDTIVIKSVRIGFEEFNKKTVAVIKLSRFGERTYQEWEEAVNQIKNEKSTLRLRSGQEIQNFGGIVLDLRNNPGGFLEGAVFIASEFLPASPSQGGSAGTVVQQDSGSNGKQILKVNRRGSLLSDPLVVLINEGSASASEIVAGALQEAKRARLVGVKSFGKGTVQEAEDLPGRAGLHITVARWLLPSGTSIDKAGVKPDIEVKADENDLENDLQLKKALEILTK